MWKGRLSPPAEVARRFTESLSVDQRLFRYDIAGSIAHARALAAAGIISAEENGKIDTALREIESEIASGRFQWDSSLEDVHMNIEAALTARTGQTGAKLHTARSRNDQIALDLRLYVKDQIGEITTRLKQLQSALVSLGDTHADVIMPGYTHLQRAQPIYFAHYLLGQVEALQRDCDRLNDCRKRVDVLPLGSAALAGSTISVDRELLAHELGFAAISRNSIDAVGDRDFVCEFLFGLAACGMHLSRLAEDFIVWSTAEFGFIEFSDAFSTGSSLMPQKKNPDVAELTRGKAGRLYGNLLSILTTLKGLPASYNRDFQEDKRPLFDSVDTVVAIVEVWCAMLPEINVRRDRMEAAASDPNLLATDLVEYLVRKGVPFRHAHEIVGGLVRRAQEWGKRLSELSQSELREVSEQFDGGIAQVFDARAALSQRSAVGAPSPQNIKAELERWRTQLR